MGQDHSRAVHFFQLAADQGLAEAQYFLGVAYQVSDMIVDGLWLSHGVC